MFQSIYQPGLELIEQREGNKTLYPATDQLPVLLRALNLEFYGGLPGTLTRVLDHADAFERIVFNKAANLFCASVHASRADGLLLFPLVDRDLMTRVAIAQHIEERQRQSVVHYFRFFADNFFQEIYLSGKRVRFTGHVMDRFHERVPGHINEERTDLLLRFFGQPMIAMPTNPGRSLFLKDDNSFVALTYKESESEFLVTTCLTVHELLMLEKEIPPEALNLHYGVDYKTPEIRHWIPTDLMLEVFKSWERKNPLPSPQTLNPHNRRWNDLAYSVEDVVRKFGHTRNSQFGFLDNIPGPCSFEIKHGERLPQYNEVELYRQRHPEVEWSALFAQRRVHRTVKID